MAHRWDEPTRLSLLQAIVSWMDKRRLGRQTYEYKCRLQNSEYMECFIRVKLLNTRAWASTAGTLGLPST